MSNVASRSHHVEREKERENPPSPERPWEGEDSGPDIKSRETGPDVLLLPMEMALGEFSLFINSLGRLVEEGDHEPK